MDEFERIALTSLTGLLREGRTMEEAVAKLKQMMSAELVDRAVRHYKEVARGVREFRDPPVLEDPRGVPQPWYTGPQTGDLFWPALESHLREKPAWKGHPLG